MNEDNKHLVRRTLLPSGYEVLAYLSLAIASLFILNLVHILKSYGSNGDVVLSEYLHRTIVRVAHSFDAVLGARWGTVLFWMLVGAAVYLCFWVGATISSAYRHDVPPLHGFVLPTGYARAKAWHSALGRFMVRLFATVALIWWFYIFFAKVLPYTSDRFVDGFVNFQPMKIVDIGLSIIVTAISLFLFSVLLRLLFLRSRVFNG